MFESHEDSHQSPIESLSEWCEVRRGRKKALGLRVQKTDDRWGPGAAGAAEAADCLLVHHGWNDMVCALNYTTVRYIHNTTLHCIALHRRTYGHANTHTYIHVYIYI